MKKFRNLTDTEIKKLEQQMCTCDEWSTIFVPRVFDTSCIHNSHFSGVVKIDSQTEHIKLYGGLKRQAGIYNSTIHNCGIGKNCYINSIKTYLSNYNIGDNVIINNVQLIANEGKSTFGNGLPISVLDESGGRQIMMFDNLSAQIAYIMTLYRYRPNLIKKLEEIITKYAESKSNERGYIGSKSHISNTGTIKNVWIEKHATIDGARRLENGTIKSNVQAPTYIGDNVIAENFIIQTGSMVKEGVIIENCFVGQSCELGRSYAADNSVFFANCQGFNGEACSIFAGPFTVTHHKSTLLIAGMYSFLNAGSGSNQSNHMYKLGPIHQGIVERGSKTTSDSYLLWPARIGPFTLVMGRHFKNSDTTYMPFSYMIERDDKSWLAPGVNLRSVGTIRDAMKWPKRDKRKDPNRLDCINFNLLSPYTIQKMLNALEIMEDLQKVSGEASDEFVYQSTSISNTSLKRGIQLYNIAINKFLGNSVITRIHNSNFKCTEDLQNRLQPDSDIGTGKWIDVGGLLAPQKEITKLLDAIENNQITKLEEIQKFLVDLHESYYKIEWNWSAALLEKRLGKSISQITPNDMIELVNRWKKSVVDLDHMLYNDARKEFQLSAMTGFGSDGDAKTMEADFAEVRGKFETNSFVAEILNHIERKSKLGDKVIGEIQNCCVETT